MLETSIPNFSTKSITGCGPVLSTRFAEITFIDCANADFNVTIPPYLLLEFLGVHGFSNPYLPCSMV